MPVPQGIVGRGVFTRNEYIW